MGRTAGKYLMEKPHKPQENSHTMVWYTIIIGETWSAPADSKLCFRLTKTGRFNGEYTDKPSLPPDAPESWGISYRHVPCPFGMGSCGWIRAQKGDFRIIFHKVVPEKTGSKTLLEGLNKKVKGVMYTRNALVLFRLGCIKEAKYFISGFFPPTLLVGGSRLPFSRYQFWKM